MTKPINLLVLFFVVNIIAISATVYALRPNSHVDFSMQTVSIQQPNPQDPELITDTPKSISIPSIGLNVPIEAGVYNTTETSWTLNSDTAHYALITPKPNNLAGNTFIYGHNNPVVFGRLVDILPGTEAIVTGKKGIEFRYLLRSVVDVDPTDVSLFEYEGGPILTIQTCAGSWFENRRLFTFELIEIQND